ncbi:MAG TPA: hypothetical protein VF657_01710 [Actinoplanes sp.]
MTDPVHSPDAPDGAEPRPVSPPSEPPGAPRWVKVSAIIAAVVVLLIVILNLTGHGGSHGPSRHTGAPASITVQPATDDVDAGYQRTWGGSGR